MAEPEPTGGKGEDDEEADIVGGQLRAAAQALLPGLASWGVRRRAGELGPAAMVRSVQSLLHSYSHSVAVASSSHHSHHPFCCGILASQIARWPRALHAELQRVPGAVTLG